MNKEGKYRGGGEFLCFHKNSLITKQDNSTYFKFPFKKIHKSSNKKKGLLF